MGIVRNQNFKMAREIGSETGDHFIINGVSGDKLLENEIKQQYNAKVDEYTSKLDNYTESLEEYAKTFNDSIGDMEIKAIGSQMLVIPFSTNPFQHIKTTDSGIYLNIGGLKPEIKSNESGEYEEEDPNIIVGSVIDAGPGCRYIKEGDVVMWMVNNQRSIPFYNQNLFMISEAAVLCVINSGLTERFNNIKK